MTNQNFKSVKSSQVEITELMIPSYANFGGKIHGGIILSLMDKAAYACSAKHSGGYCVTASMNATDFLAPVNVGDLVHLYTSVNYVGKSSMVIGVKVVAENVTSGETLHTNSSYFTMVAINDDRTPRLVPGLTLESKKEARRFIEAIRRRELIKQYKQEFKQVLTDEEVDAKLNILEDQRCQINF